jgi:DNA primase
MKIDMGLLNDKLADRYEYVFDALGIDLETFRCDQHQCRGRAICHDGDNPTAFVYYPNAGNWCCFTKHCEKKYSAGLIGLIRAVTRKGFIDTVEFAQELADKEDVAVIKREPIPEEVKIDAWAAHLNQEKFSNNILNKLENCDEHLLERNLDLYLCESLGIGLATVGRLRDRIVIPIRNVLGDIVGFTGRSVEKNYKPKWFHDSFKKRHNLYNIDIANKSLQKTENPYIILTEGPWDTIKFLMAGIKQVVALFGCSLTSGQIELLNMLNIVNVYLALDNDEAGRESMIKNKIALEKALFNVEVLIPSGNDFGDMSPKDVRKIVKEGIK